MNKNILKKQVIFLAMGILVLTGCQTVNTNSANVEIQEEENTEGKILKDDSTNIEKDYLEEKGTEEGTYVADERGTQETEAESETETKAVPETQTVTITAAGDCTFACTQTHGYEGSFHEYYDKNGEEYFFAGVRDYFEEDDVTVINLECVLSTSEDRVDKKFNLRGKPEYTNVMTSSSVEACSLGNNHTMDYGPKSLDDTREALDQAGILYGYNDHTALYTTDDGVEVGIVSANLLYQTQEYEDYIKNGISALREQGAEIVIACCHWGIEREYYPTDYQTAAAHRVIDWGADLVLGCHPHVLQGMEYYKGRVICYSLGNFCFGGNSNPSDKDTMLFQQTFTLVDGKLTEDLNARIVPCTLSSVTGYNDYQPTVARGERKDRIISNMNNYCAPYSELKIDSEGALGLE